MRKALIVDDHPSIRMVLRMQLEKVLGIATIEEAENGQVAIDYVRSEPFDLIVIDLDLPRINGLELINRIHAMDPHIKLLVLSGQDEAVYAGRAMQAGAHGFVSKQNEMSEFVRAVELVLAGYSCFPQNLLLASRKGRPVENVQAGSNLTDKELAILRYLANGLSNKQISERLFISNKTVSTHKTRIMNKLKVSTLVELVDYARRNNITVITE
ncbi:response regulator transcription factor [Enterobacter mori]|uniref:response regulator transcription factor n=1 Tax=Enterobacter mori TaxID=539813 RepID=UPI001B8C8A68|nr:response regulator transcription factor [Enterobacter mori]MBS3046382.1 response regulator [Enterobacter mori]